MDRLSELGARFRAGRNEIDPALPTLLMIHGAGGSSNMWQAQLRPLAKSLNPIAIDLPGHGEAIEQGLYSIESYAEWLAGLISNLRLSPLFLMGHSMGGAVVLKTTSLCRDIIHGTILAGTGRTLSVSPLILEGLKRDFEKTVDSLLGYAYAPEADAALIREGSRIMKQAGAERVYKDFLACDQYDASPYIKDSGGRPCLIVCGAMDKLTPPSLARELHSLIEGSTMEIIPYAGHMVMIEKFREFNECVNAFVLREWSNG